MERYIDEPEELSEQYLREKHLEIGLYPSAEEITKHIYAAFGSDTEYLFGISPEHKKAVISIVEQTLKYLSRR